MSTFVELATRLIRRERPTPVVMMTAFDRPSSLVRSIVAGATSYLVKPFVEDELEARIAAATRHPPATHRTGRRTTTPDETRLLCHDASSQLPRCGRSRPPSRTRSPARARAGGCGDS